VLSPRATLDAAFSGALQSRGFGRRDNEPCSFIARVPERGAELHVDVELSAEPSAFRVVLQDVRSSSRRFELLEEFEGLQRYEFTAADPDSLQAAIDIALLHLERYGIPWLEGQEVTTQSLQSRAALGHHERYRRLVHEAREAFRSGSKTQARSLLEEAAELHELDSVAEKMLSLLRRGSDSEEK
jgi:hypothetical protein